MNYIKGNKIVLREYRESDIPIIYDWANDRATTYWMGRKFREGRSLDAVTNGVKNIINSPPNDGVFFVIEDCATEEYIRSAEQIAT